MGYISSKETIMGRFYDDGAILRLSQSSLERQYQDMLLALQPLAVLPFQVEYDIVASYSLVDSAYMGESDIEPQSPKKQEAVPSSPKIVIARSKNQAGKTPNRASWAGPTDSQEVSFTKAMDLSATWDWIKTTTLPKARSLMSDMGLMSSNTSVGSAAGSMPGSAVKVSRLSQDLASVGIVSSRQNVSVTASSSSPELAKNGTTTPAKEDQAPEARPASYPGEKPQQALPAVVMDHGTKRKVDASPARQKAEEILRRKSGELSPQKRWPKDSPLKIDPERKEVGAASKEASSHAVSSPQNIVSTSPRRSESSPIRIQEPSPRRTGSPQRQFGSPNRQSGSPSRQSGSPNRQSGSPNRGPLINPGSPKSTVAGARERAPVETISRRTAKVTLDDFPEDDDKGTMADNTAGALSPLATIATATQKLVAKKEEKVYREGKTDYAFDAASKSPQDPAPPLPTRSTPTQDVTSPEATAPAGVDQTGGAATASPPAQAGTTGNVNSNQAAGRSKLSGLRRLSPKGSFNIISFFDRLLLPAEKANAAAVTKASTPVPRENLATEWDSQEQVSSIATGTSSTASSSAPSPTPPESLHTSSSTSNNSSPRHGKLPTSQSRSSLNRASRIPKRQSESPTSRTDETKTTRRNPRSEKKTTTTTTATTNTTLTNSRPIHRPEPIPVTTRQQRTDRTDRSETPEVDINANSPEFHPSEPEEMFVEHNPIGHWGGSSSETGQSDGSGQSVSMEEDQPQYVWQGKQSSVRGQGSGPLKMPSYKWVEVSVV